MASVYILTCAILCKHEIFHYKFPWDYFICHCLMRSLEDLFVVSLDIWMPRYLTNKWPNILGSIVVLQHQGQLLLMQIKFNPSMDKSSHASKIWDEMTPYWLHWAWVTHICIGNLTTIGLDNSLSSGLGQAIIWTNSEISLIWPLGTNFSEILIQTLIYSFKKMHLKMLAAKYRLSCLSLNELTTHKVGQYQNTTSR